MKKGCDLWNRGVGVHLRAERVRFMTGSCKNSVRTFKKHLAIACQIRYDSCKILGKCFQEYLLPDLSYVIFRYHA